MSVLLKIASVLVALIVGLVLALLLFFASPTIYGLRPHAVEPDMDTHTIGDLLALSEHGPVTGFLTYDAWYAGRAGQTGWFLLRPDNIEELQFAVNGRLNPSLSKMFGPSPRKCRGTTLSEKMIRAIEPERRRSGFLGRSTCSRVKMDVSEIIAASTPAIRHEEHMSHAALLAFDNTRTQSRQRDAVESWPTAYSHYRAISLPIIWDRFPVEGKDLIQDLSEAAQNLATQYSVEGEISIRLRVRDWQPRRFADITPNQMPIELGSDIVLINGIRVRSISLVILCSPAAIEACNRIEVSSLQSAVDAGRDSTVWTKALETAQPLPDGISPLRDYLKESDISRTTPITHGAEERRFLVTWYDVRAP